MSRNLPICREGYTPDDGDYALSFSWEFCKLCDCMMVVCPLCGNNTCNASYGTVTTRNEPVPAGVSYWDNDLRTYREGFKRCAVCELAYQYKNLAYKTNTVPAKPQDDVTILVIDE